MRPTTIEPEGPRRRRSLGPAALALAAALLLARPAQAPASPSALPPRVDAARLQALLQSFVDKTYLKAFRHLGDERDFDHGHFLFASAAPGAAPVAILYHTQELAYYAAKGSAYAWLDPEGRNWIQWLSDGRVENARRYLSAHPGPLPVDPRALSRHHTILAAMLEPSAFGARRLLARQVVFSREACPARLDRSSTLVIRLPGAARRVCLSLSEY